MTIKEIAKLAYVSTSTVSKIINKKDEHISEETRERVLRIIKEYNYTPYAKLKSMRTSPTFMIGVLTGSNSEHEAILTGIVNKSKQKGYSTIVLSASAAEEEFKNLSILSSHCVDGIIWCKNTFSDDNLVNKITELGIPFNIIGHQSSSPENTMYYSFEELAHTATLALVSRSHRNIGCVVPEIDSKGLSFINGFKQCLFENQVQCDDSKCIVWNEENEDMLIWLRRLTGVVCMEEDIAASIYKYAELHNIKIPSDMSIVSLRTDGKKDLFSKVSVIELPMMDFGGFVADVLIDKIRGKQTNGIKFKGEYKINNSSSIDMPNRLKSKKIIVVGAINMDTLLGVKDLPEAGKTVSINSRSKIPGGKGLNQALGASKLGANAFLIGKLGKDYDGGKIYEYLKMNNVNIEGVQSAMNTYTGHAYIFVQKDAESSISVYDGANRFLNEKDISEYEHLFKDASFCLLQTELRQSVVAYAASVARRHGARVILKPCAISALDDALIKNVDILVPNKKEIELLASGFKTYEEKAQYFIDMGIPTVIITLGHEGCYLRDENHSRYFSAFPVVPVDTTGAADAFIATLAVYLSMDYGIEKAIRYAIIASGLSTTRLGVPTSLVDRDTLEMNYKDA